jgi:hypothetical protein
MTKTHPEQLYLAYQLIMNKLHLDKIVSFKILFLMRQIGNKLSVVFPISFHDLGTSPGRPEGNAGA